MRWADLDLLGHINNVVYVDYLQEARVDMLRVHAPDSRAEDLAEGVVVVRHEVTYVAPLTLERRTVSIECWVTRIRAASFTMAYEVFHESDGHRTVHLRATTVLTPYVFASERPRRISPEEREVLERFLEPQQEAAASAARRDASPARKDEEGHYPLHVRFSDVDVYGHVNNVQYFEFFQEARILLIARLGRDIAGAPDLRMVTAQTDVDYKLPLLFRREPYDCWSWISYVGSSSLTIESEICDGDRVLSRAQVVAVWFDLATQRPMVPPVALRAALVAASSEPGSPVPELDRVRVR